MLAELREAHETLLNGIQELEDATHAPAPDPSVLAAIRWRLSRASGQRRRLIEQACTRLREGASPGVAAAIDRLRQNSAEMLAASSRHVGGWTIDHIVADWEGYRAASTAMRAAMRRRIEREKSTLYPLLAGAG